MDISDSRVDLAQDHTHGARTLPQGLPGRSDPGDAEAGASLSGLALDTPTARGPLVGNPRRIRL